MNFNNHFQTTPSISPDEVRETIESKKASDFCLLDVRQPMENAQSRLPGSILIPLGELNMRFSELDKSKTIIVYCRSGSRSVSATNFLIAEGYTKSLNMTGGIIRYNGMIASGPPEAASACFATSQNAVQMAATAWMLEEGTIKFIEYLCHEVLNNHEPALFDEIIEAKRTHQKTLSSLVAELSGMEISNDFPADVVELPDVPVMIGCIKLSDATAWANDKKLKDLLEMMMSLSANSYDYYLRLGLGTDVTEELKVFDILACEEHLHLERLAQAYEVELSGS